MKVFQHRIFDPGRLAGLRVLDIGCGRQKFPGTMGLDERAFPGVDVVSDLNNRLPFPDK